MGGHDMLAVVVAWIFQIGFFGAILFAVYRINNLHQQMQQLREDMRAVRQRVEGIPPAE